MSSVAAIIPQELQNQTFIGHMADAIKAGNGAFLKVVQKTIACASFLMTVEYARHGDPQIDLHLKRFEKITSTIGNARSLLRLTQIFGAINTLLYPDIEDTIIDGVPKSPRIIEAETAESMLDLIDICAAFPMFLGKMGFAVGMPVEMIGNFRSLFGVTGDLITFCRTATELWYLDAAASNLSAAQRDALYQAKVDRIRVALITLICDIGAAALDFMIGYMAWTAMTTTWLVANGALVTLEAASALNTFYNKWEKTEVLPFQPAVA